MDLLVSTQWLSTHLDDPHLVVLDSTVIVKMDAKGGMSNISGLEQYLQGHIPNARFADLKGALSNHNSSLDFVMPTSEQFAAAIGELGIDNQSCMGYPTLVDVTLGRARTSGCIGWRI
jgi:thiosulfate/3-mercaptopyruvate sulfurtransferase